MKKIVTRRDFLKGAALGTLGVALAGKKAAAAARDFVSSAPEAAASQVVLIRNEGAVGAGDTINPAVVQEMIDSALMKFTGEADALKAWSHFLKPEDTVGVKITRCDWMRIPTEQPVVDAVVKRVSDLKIPKNRIFAQDGGLPAGKCTALINVPSVKVHTLVGIAASMKNYINLTPNPSKYHGDKNGNLGEAWTLPNVKEKTRLIIVDMLRPYFGPGPQINPLHRWNYEGIMVGTDPVAVDTVCLQICQAKRKLFKGEDWPISPPPALFLNAADKQFNLGTSDPSKIKLVKVGWDKDILI